jgi:hypothetical protein
MKMRRVVAILIILFSAHTDGIASEDLFPGEGIGAIKLLGEDQKQYTVEIVFPLNWGASLMALRTKDNMFKSNVKISTKKPIYLFDDKGQIGVINIGEFKLTFWCDSDAGVQFRPTAIFNIEKAGLIRPLIKKKGFQNFVAFASLGNKIKGSPSYDHIEKPLQVYNGDMDGDGKTDAMLVVEIDDANNCDGKHDTNKLIGLDVEKNTYPLRCCGP